MFDFLRNIMGFYVLDLSEKRDDTMVIGIQDFSEIGLASVAGVYRRHPLEHLLRRVIRCGSCHKGAEQIDPGRQHVVSLEILTTRTSIWNSNSN